MEKLNLAPNTAKLWRRLRNEALLKDFYLIGGTALALLIEHRLSEDLDFFYKKEPLPVDNINRLIHALKQEGCQVSRSDKPSLYEQFKEAGLSLHDYQQNFIIDGTKLTFFTGQPLVADLLTSPTQNKPIIPALKELFDTKAITIENRSQSRDAFDIYILMKKHGFTLADFIDAYQKAGQGKYSSPAIEKLTILKFGENDTGYMHLTESAPTIEEMRNFFNRVYTDYKA